MKRMFYLGGTLEIPLATRIRRLRKDKPVKSSILSYVPSRRLPNGCGNGIRLPSTKLGILVVFIPLIAFFAVLIGCSSEDSQIVGHWRVGGTKESFEFRDDGSFDSGPYMYGGRERTWRMENILILSGIDTFSVKRVHDDRLQLLKRGSVIYNLSRYGDQESLSRRDAAFMNGQSLKLSTGLLFAQIKHLQAERDSLQRELADARARADSLESLRQ